MPARRLAAREELRQQQPAVAPAGLAVGEIDELLLRIVREGDVPGRAVAERHRHRERPRRRVSQKVRMIRENRAVLGIFDMRLELQRRKFDGELVVPAAVARQVDHHDVLVGIDHVPYYGQRRAQIQRLIKANRAGAPMAVYATIAGKVRINRCTDR